MTISSKNSRQYSFIMGFLFLFVFVGVVQAAPSLLALQKQLKSPHSPTRLAATKALALRGESGVSGLLQALEDRQWRIREIASLALVRLGPKILPQLTKALRSPHPRVRLHVAEVFGKLGTQARPSLGALHGAMHDREWGVRVAVMRTLGLLHSKRSILVFVHHLKRDLYWRVRALAAKALKFFITQSPGLLVHLVKASQDKHEAVRYEASITLTELHKIKSKENITTTIIPIFKRGLRDRSWRVRWASAHGLGQWKEDARVAIAALRSAFRDKRRNIREMAAIALGQIGKPAQMMVPIFVKILEVDKAMPLAVKNLRSPLGRISVAMKLKHRLPYLKMLFGVTRGLAEFGPLAIVELQRALHRSKKPNPWIIFTLGCIGTQAKAALPTLLRWSKHPKADYRWMVMLALSRIGPQSAKVRKVLWQGRKDRDAVVRTAAAQALAEVKDPRFLRSPANQRLQKDRSHVRLGAKNLISFMKTRSMTPKLFLK